MTIAKQVALADHRHETPGRLTSRSTFKIGHDYRLVLPIAAYQSWKGVCLEGKDVEPDVEVNSSFEDAIAGRDRHLD
jgi:C-terminal processing protease CtpA/Prc